MIASSALVVLVSLMLPQTDPATEQVAAMPSEIAAFDAGLPVANDVLAHAHSEIGLDPATALSEPMVDERSRADFRTFGTISRTQMDVWWGTTGASLIASAVRSAGPPS